MKHILAIVTLMFTLSFTVDAQLNTERYYNVGRSRIYYGNYTGAIENFNIIIKLKPYLYEPYFLRGVSKFYLEDYRGALKDFKLALNIKPFYPEAYIYKAQAHSAMKEFEKALNCYSKAVELDPDNAGVYNNRGNTFKQMKRYKEALSDYNKTLKLRPNYAGGFLNRSAVRITLGDIEGGIADCDTAIRIRPHFGGAYLNRGLAKAQLKDYAGSLSDYDKAIELNPQDEMGYSNRGIIKHQLGDYSGAIIDYNHAIRINPSFDKAYHNRGLAKEALKKDATNDFATAGLLNPTYQRNSGHVYVNKTSYSQSQFQKSTKGRSQKQNKIIGIGHNNQEKNATIDIETQRRLTQQRKRKNQLRQSQARPLTEKEKKLTQNLEFDIKLAPLFVLTTINENSSVSTSYFNNQIDALNRLNSFDPYLALSNEESWHSEQKESYNNYIRFFNAKIKNNNQVASNFLNRSIFLSLTTQYNKSLNDLNAALSLDNQMVLAYFERANVRSQVADAILGTPDFAKRKNVASETKLLASKVAVEQEVSEYNEAIKDLDKVIYMNPNFYFAHFNKANIKCKIGKYNEAIQLYTKAIDIENEFAEAYFNRGLIKVYLNKIEEGAADLSKAGELGLESAYSIIKKYCYVE